MLKKLLAGLTAVVLSLGMVALTAGPASAHHNTINASVSCNTGTEGTWKVTWTIENSENRAETITASNDISIVPVDAVIDAKDTLTVVKYYTTKPASNFTLTLSAKWTNNSTNTSHGTLYAADFANNCLPDNTDRKVDVCHYDNGHGGKYTLNDISVSAVLNGQSHGGNSGTHAQDIIPPFDYIKNGVEGHYPGKNWDAYGQWVYNNGCSNDVTSTKPVFTQAVCTAEGQVGGAGYTIPSIIGVKYEKSNNGWSGWTEVLPGPHSVADGTTVWIRAVALTGYDLDGEDKWKLEFDDVNSSKCVVPANPTPTYSECTTTPGQSSQASYLIPSDTGIQYQRWNGTEWVNVSAGSVNVSTPAAVQLRAVPKNGYTIVGGPYTWTYDFANAGDCLEPVVPGDPSFTNSVCEANTTGSTQGGYFIPTTANVSYTVSVNGAPAVPATTGSIVPTAPGDQVTITAIAATGYSLTGDIGPWSHSFADPGECLDDATPVTPTFENAVCVTPGTGTTSGSYVVDGAANVIYEVKIDDGSWTVVDPATYGEKVEVAPGTKVEVRAKPAAGYQLDGYTPWPAHTFTNPGDCLDDVAVQPVVGTDQVCVIDDLNTGTAHYESGTITIPTTAHVTYSVNGIVTGAGPHNFAPGNYTISAVADPGYQLTGVPDPWKVEIVAAEPCGQLGTHGTVTPVVSFTETTCSATGTYTLGVAEPGNEPGVIWTVSGGLPTTIGTHNVASAGEVTITADRAPGYGFTGPVNQPLPLVWKHTFTELPDDCLPTLALPTLAVTGGGIGLGMLGLSAVLTLGGILLFTARRRHDVAGTQG